MDDLFDDFYLVNSKFLVSQNYFVDSYLKLHLGKFILKKPLEYW